MPFVDMKNLIVEKRHNELFEKIRENRFQVDEVFDLPSGQRIIHLAVIFDDEVLVDFVINNGGHLMARDYNGYTPLLKAASLGRLNIVTIPIKMLSKG